MSEPIPVMVKRFRCPHCPRSLSSKGRMVEHISRCWRNPATRGCLTCRHFEAGYHERCDAPHGCGACGAVPDSCAAGVDLSGRQECDGCAGERRAPIDAGVDIGVKTCPECGGDGAERKPGPITGCDKWEALMGASEEG